MFASLLLPLLPYTLLLSKALQPDQHRYCRKTILNQKKVGKLSSKSKDRAKASMFLAAPKEESMCPIMLQASQNNR